MTTWRASFSGPDLTPHMRLALDGAGLSLTGLAHSHASRWSYSVFVDGQDAGEAIKKLEAALATFPVTIDPEAEPFDAESDRSGGSD